MNIIQFFMPTMTVYLTVSNTYMSIVTGDYVVSYIKRFQFLLQVSLIIINFFIISRYIQYLLSVSLNIILIRFFHTPRYSN